MLAITVVPGTAESLKVEEVDEPDPDQGEVLVDAVALGVCGTDREIVNSSHGSPPAGKEPSHHRTRIARARSGMSGWSWICSG